MSVPSTASPLLPEPDYDTLISGSMEVSDANINTFGGLIRQARQKKGLSQKDVAGRLLKENSETISAQYLSDIEHDRRHPPADAILRQLASLLELNADRLFLAAARVPADIQLLAIHKPTIIQRAFDICRNERGSDNA